MIQDIGKNRLRIEYAPEIPSDICKVLVFRKNRYLAKVSENHMLFPNYGEVKSKYPLEAKAAIYLFRLDDQRFFLITNIPEEGLEGYEWCEQQVFRQIENREMAFAGVTGMQLAQWYESRKICPRCGEKLVHSPKERMMECPSCKLTEYPKICPAVIVGVINGDRILLTKYAGRNYTRYALIAGFSEIGESLEATVEREVMEEVGLKVKNIRYYKSQPWGFSSTLLAGFFAEVDGSDEIHLDETELAVGEWHTRDEIPQDDGVSLTREMMRVFREGKYYV